ncbi:MAG: MinD/ParA family protein [Firmicutes bacterium]|jgi:flagellar biosynthesis protein FlhG|nr:MinD/ParA family protein [Bacillota bacterium]
MSKQAKSLRRVIDDYAGQRLHVIDELTSSPQRTIAITSGKGGVGKSNLVINMAIALASSGMRVLVVDADLGLANIDLLLGITTPYTLEHVATGEVSLEDIQVTGPGGIKIIPGGSGAQRLLRTSEEERASLMRSLRELDDQADFIIIDTGAGLSPNVLTFLKFVHEIIVVTTPEPTSVADAYATVKTIAYENPGASIMIVVNMARSPKNAQDIAGNISVVAKKFLGIDLDFLGSVPRDPMVLKAVAMQQPFLLSYPSSNASKAVIRLTEKLAGEKQEASGNMRWGLSELFSRMFYRVESDHI